MVEAIQAAAKKMEQERTKKLERQRNQERQRTLARKVREKEKGLER